LTGTHWRVCSYDDFVIHNRAFVARDAAGPIAMLVCDEAHLLGQVNTLRRECVSIMSADKVLLLTATPCSTDLTQLWLLLYLADPGCAVDPETWQKLVIGSMEEIQAAATNGAAIGMTAAVGKAWFDELVAQYVLRRTRPVGSLDQ
jgi:hypothetical protein